VFERQDQVYGAVVRHVLPGWSLGLFAAVLMGSILSSFNSALNSASTLFSLQFYKGYINQNASDREVVSTGRSFGIVLALASIIIAPLLSQLDSIFQYLQKVNGIYSVPIIAIFLLGILTKHIPAIGAKIGMAVGFISYAYFVFFPIENFHWLHMYFISFTWSIMVMLLIGYLKPKTDEEIKESDKRDPAPVDMPLSLLPKESYLQAPDHACHSLLFPHQSSALNIQSIALPLWTM
jgi:SSS family solute:Na+ symporter